ncbi:glycoside hydrolase family 97 protein [Parabacteroides pacaensis]|uniref:glycoside hydrolase family 97 protein n=1 Tax=Parabacteroides pacaensis TaxID=2086575 RepID=UPI000D10BC1A|nr:glycoside hydrolase family 97 protein [Parabacteroides pacaensis]
MKLKTLFIALLLTGSMAAIAQKTYQVQSPDGKLKAVVTVKDQIEYSVTHDGTEVLAPSSISMTLQDGKVLGANPRVIDVLKQSVNTHIVSPLYKKAEVTDHFNEMELKFKGNFSIVFRAYDDGLAYRFKTKMKDEIIVENEEATFNFSEDNYTYAPYVNSKADTFEKQFFNSFEQTYVHQPVTQLNNKRLMFLPFLVELKGGKKLCITEADLEDYPGMFLNNSTTEPSLKSVFAPYPKSTQQGGHNMLQKLVTERENYIAKTNGTRSFPWRALIVSEKDADLANCDMVYRLASPVRLLDTSWIKPGKVAWDWWNDWNLHGVDFRAGINNETYKYYIDFASKNGIEYVILDEGWAVNKQADLMQVIPEINLQEIVNYGKSKNVGIILWAGYWAFHRDMENVVKHFADMGVKGFKVDFMDRDDQEMVNFLYKAAEVCAENKMMLDFHGVFKPTGLQRTFPNVINYEGVAGLEQLKWAPEGYDMVTYDVTIPYIRQVAGPMDYTQGAMRNAVKQNYHSVYSEPMSQGTRCRQLATYIIFESPLNMLCDNPSNYMKEQECTDFIAAVPTVWDETKALDGEVAKYIALARRYGNNWYIGALTNWDKRELTLDLSFLGEGNYKAEIFKDGINADKAACDYKKEVIDIPANRQLTIKMAPGGGYVAKIYK